MDECKYSNNKVCIQNERFVDVLTASDTITCQAAVTAIRLDLPFLGQILLKGHDEK